MRALGRMGMAVLVVGGLLVLMSGTARADHRRGRDDGDRSPAARQHMPLPNRGATAAPAVVYSRPIIAPRVVAAPPVVVRPVVVPVRTCQTPVVHVAPASVCRVVVGEVLITICW